MLGVDFADLHRGGWDPDARLPEQDRDGVAGEIIYPTVGMVLCNHQDLDYKHACMDAYNLWIAEYCAAHPDRLFGIGQTAMRTPEEGIADLRAASHALGLKGVMMPGVPGVGGLRLPDLRRLLRGGRRPRPAAVVPHPHRPVGQGARPEDQRLPHHRAQLPGRHGHARVRRRVRAPPGAEGGVRRGRRRLGAPLRLPDGPRLRPAPQLDAPRRSVPQARASTSTRTSTSRSRTTGWRSRSPHLMNVDRLMWANDFPHSDSTWPWSQEMLAEHTAHLTDARQAAHPARQRGRALRPRPLTADDRRGAPMLDLKITGGTVIDGTGAAGHRRRRRRRPTARSWPSSRRDARGRRRGRRPPSTPPVGSWRPASSTSTPTTTPRSCGTACSPCRRGTA